MDPLERKPMHQTALIKFRVTADEKATLISAARKAEVTVSSLLRRAGRAVTGGRVASRSILNDLVAIRAAANALADVASDPASEPERLADAAKKTAKFLRDIASHHLDQVR